MKFTVFASCVFSASAIQEQAASCEAEDLAVRVQLQNKLADVCIDMCKELGAYPEKCTCPGYTDTTDKTPNTHTWEELLGYIDSVEEYGHSKNMEWTKKYSAIQKTKQSHSLVAVSRACLAQDLKHRAMVQNKLAGACEDMCKEVGAYPARCTCPGYVDTTDKTPNVVTWPELLGYMDSVGDKGAAAIKNWHSAAAGPSASAIQVQAASCEAEDLAVRAQLQNKLADVCIDMCKELGAYPEKCTCPGYTDTTDKTPNTHTWEELLGYIDSVEEYGHNKNMEWTKKYSAIQKAKQSHSLVSVSKACMAQDLKHRAMVQNKLAGACEDMCKEVGAYPERCTCPGYVDTTDKTPNVVTWPELLDYMDTVGDKGAASIKTWHSAAASR